MANGSLGYIGVVEGLGFGVLGFGAPGLRLRAENVLQREQGSNLGLRDWGLGVWEVEFRNMLSCFWCYTRK